MFELLARRPRFRRLWAASTVSLLGDWLGFVAISRLVLDKGGGPLALALVYAAHILPHTWAMPVAGVIADRYDRRKLLVFVPIIQGVLTIAMAAAAANGALGLLQLLVVIRATFATAMPPAETAALRHTVESNELVSANALMGGTWSTAYVLGMAIGGAIAVFGPGIALLLDASSFFLGAFLAAALPSMLPPKENHREGSNWTSFLVNMPHDLKIAFNHARSRDDLFRAVLGKAPVAIGGGVGWIVLNLVADRAQPLGTAAMSLGILQAIRGAGTGIGPAAVAWYARGATPPRMIERMAVIVSFSSIIAFSLVPGFPSWLVLMTFLWGIGTGTNWVVTAANMQRLAPDAMIGRLSSIDELFTTGFFVLGTFIAALLLEAGLSMPHVAAIGMGLGLLLFVWLDQRQTKSLEVAAPNHSGP
jgi:MFS family permease